MMSISTTLRSGVLLDQLDRLAAVGGAHAPPSPGSRARVVSAKMLRASSSTTSTLRPRSTSFEPCSRSSICRLALGQVGDDAVQEQRGLVEQPLGRLHVLEHDALGHRSQPRLLVGRQLLAGEHDDRHVAQRRLVPASARAARSRSCPAGADRRRSSRTALRRSASSASAPVPTAVDLDVVVRRAARRCSRARCRCPRPPAAACVCGVDVRLDAVEARARDRSVVAGLTRYENAPCDSPCCRSSSTESICTGMCRVAGSSLRLFSTVQPSMSGRNTSRVIAVGQVLRAPARAPSGRAWRRCP